MMALSSTLERECPICLCDIEGQLNQVTTECGHTFHCSCLMQNVAHNGFDCPYCRTAMAQYVQDSDSDDDYSSRGNDYNDNSDDDDDDSVSVAGPGLEAHLLRGMRWMFQRVSNEVDKDEDEDEDDDEESVWETDSDSDSDNE